MEQDDSTCLGIKCVSKVATEITLSDIYAVEIIDHGLIHISNLPHATERLLLGHEIKVCFVLIIGYVILFLIDLSGFILSFIQYCRCTALQCMVLQGARINLLSGYWLNILLVIEIYKHVRCG